MEGMRAVIYCRVSTSSDSQMESLDKQVAEAEEAAKGLGYQLVDRFIDEGKTGTTKYARKEYLRMLSTMEQDRFDVIVTKSLDRMNRNILDFYLFLDLLIKNRILLYFYLDRAFYKTDDKIVIGIKAILAEEYSRELSKKLCNAHKKRQERGEVIMLGSLTYGYQKEILPDGSKRVVIVKEEAQMIRLIFDCCLQGCGVRAIARILEEKGYKNRRGNPIGESTVRRLIRNPLVTGTMVMNRVKYDFNTKTTVHTDPSQWIWKEKAVPPIISREDWEEANHLLTLRQKKQGKASGNKNRTDGEMCCGSRGGQHELSGKVFCGLCGSVYHRAVRRGSGGQTVEWRCGTYQRYGRKTPDLFRNNTAEKEVDTGSGCDNVTMKEGLFMDLFGQMGKDAFRLNIHGEKWLKEALSILKRVLEEGREDSGEPALKAKLERMEKRKETLLVKYLDQKISDDNFALMEARIERERKLLTQQMLAAEVSRDAIDNVQQRLDKMKQRLVTEGLKRAAACALIGRMDRIEVYPEYMELSWRAAKEGQQPEGAPPAANRVRVPLNAYFTKYSSRSILQSKEMVYDLIRQNPAVRVKEIAQRLELSEKTVYERVKLLKEEGRIQVSGHGRTSSWITR